MVFVPREAFGDQWMHRKSVALIQHPLQDLDTLRRSLRRQRLLVIRLRVRRLNVEQLNHRVQQVKDGPD